jgi:hypothetical protein
MGAPAKGMKAVDDSTAAEALLSAFEDIAAAERRKHATVFNYWLSIRGDRHFPPIRDLDPLEISDAGPTSVLLELIGGGEDADIRHLGQAIKAGIKVERINEAPKPSLLACIAKRLPLISNSRQALGVRGRIFRRWRKHALLGDPAPVQLHRHLRRLCLRPGDPG